MQQLGIGEEHAVYHHDLVGNDSHLGTYRVVIAASMQACQMLDCNTAHAVYTMPKRRARGDGPERLQDKLTSSFSSVMTATGVPTGMSLLLSPTRILARKPSSWFSHSNVACSSSKRSQSHVVSSCPCVALLNAYNTVCTNTQVTGNTQWEQREECCR